MSHEDIHTRPEETLAESHGEANHDQDGHREVGRYGRGGEGSDDVGHSPVQDHSLRTQSPI